MPRKFLKRLLPSPERLRSHRQIKLFGRLLEDPFLLHLNRRSVAGGVAVGLFMAFMPVPIQMLLAALASILLRVNIILAITLVWVSNPVTIPPIFFFTYSVGTWLLGAPVNPAAFAPTLEWIWSRFGDIWQPLLLGSVLVGGVVSLAAYGLIHLLWRMHVLRHWQRRRQARRDRRAAAPPPSEAIEKRTRR